MEARFVPRTITASLLLFVIIILGWSCFPSGAEAAPVVFVRPDGDDGQCNGLVDAPYPGGTGPLPCAFQTFFKAHQIVDDGGTIHVGAGTYPDGFQIAKNLTVQGAGVDDTIIDTGGTPWGIIIFTSPPDPPPTVTITGFTVQNAASASPGAGVLNWGAIVTLDSCAVRDNTANSGAGVHNTLDGIMLISNCVIEGNVATELYGGGGIVNEGSLYMENSIVRDNHADAAGANGGGLHNNNSASHEVKIYRSTFSGNSAEQSGSAIHDAGDGDVLIVNSTVTGNIVHAAYGPGDGTIASGPNGTFTMLFSTVAGNFANGPGVEGGIVTYGPVIVSNSIVANNDNAECLATGSGSITSQGHNIDSGTSCGFASAGDLVNTDPLLGSLGDYGGPTHTLPLLPGSPAINTASDIACADPAVGGIDQRGVARPVGLGCDIGAYESEFPYGLWLPLIIR